MVDSSLAKLSFAWNDATGYWVPGRAMLRIRFITTLIVALSVTLSPVVGNMAMAGSIAVPAKSVEISASHDCCDQDGVPAGNAMADCQAAAGCASKCFSLYGPLHPGMTFHPALPDIEVSSIGESLNSQGAVPPFRPPRV